MSIDKKFAIITILKNIGDSNADINIKNKG
jgi:hypothetical protein